MKASLEFFIVCRNGWPKTEVTARQKSVFPRCRDSADGDGIGDCGDRNGVGGSHGDGDGVRDRDGNGDGDSVMGMMMATVIVMGWLWWWR